MEFDEENKNKISKTYTKIKDYISQEKFKIVNPRDAEFLSKKDSEESITGEYFFFYDEKTFLDDSSKKPLDRQNYCLCLDENGYFYFQLRYGKSANLINEKQKRQKKKDSEIRKKAKDAFDKIEQICSQKWPDKFERKKNKFEKNENGTNGTIEGVQIVVDRLFFDSNDDEIKTFCQNLKSWHNQNFEKFKNIVIEVSTKSAEEIIKEIEMEKYTSLLLNNQNIILHGAPGTGKTYLAKDIAQMLIFGKVKKEEDWTDLEKAAFNNQYCFVQFHQSYDYTDFVEGLRPKDDGEGHIGFERRDGIFKTFCGKALSSGEFKTFDAAWDSLIKQVKDGVENKSLVKIGTWEYSLSSVNSLKYSSPESPSQYYSTITKDNVYKTYLGQLARESGGGKSNMRDIVNYMTKNLNLVDPKCYVFVIDEINRGEMSKIFGELFFSVDPGYRGKDGSIKTQYANLQQEPNEFDKALGITKNVVEENGKKVDLNIDQYGHFFVPENVYIIGTMNDIDRSVESMDFAMRRRFAFIDVTADSRISMLDKLGNKKTEAINRMKHLNATIEKIPGLSPAYHIGPAYFLKLEKYNGNFEQLWDNHISGVVSEYLRGIDDKEHKLFKGLLDAYNNDKSDDNLNIKKTDSDQIENETQKTDAQPEESET